MIAIARAAFLAMLVPFIVACDWSKLSDEKTQGPNPTIPTPRWALVPDVYLARAVGWPKGAMPTPAQGLAVNAFADGLDHQVPHWPRPPDHAAAEE